MPHTQFKPLLPPIKAFRFDFDTCLLEPLRLAFEIQRPFLNQQEGLFEGVFYHSEVLPDQDFYLLSYDTYPLLWLSNHNLKSYQLFETFFKALALDSAMQDSIPFDQHLQMYSGFYVLGNRATEMTWHYDYRSGAPGFTLITPLYDWNPAHGHLHYRDPADQTQTYPYQLGQAIVFGEGFEHCTEPYAVSDDLRVLVSLTFGPDQWSSWDILKQNIAEQSYYYHLPCGHAVDSCQCWQNWLQERQRKPRRHWFFGFKK